MKAVRPTLAVANILSVFLEDSQEPQYGYGLMQATGYPSGKVYQILARLTEAKWLEKFTSSADSMESGGPPRVTYKLNQEALPMARRLVATARSEVAPSRRPRPPR